MFGYIKPYQPEMKVRDQALYQGLYCGLCRTLSADFGPTASLSLNYDYVFLALMRAIAAHEKLEAPNKRCPVHPFSPRPRVKTVPSLRYAAGVTAVMTACKLEDDRTDERGAKHLRAVCLSPWANRKRRRVGKDDVPTDAIRAALDEIAQLEASACDSPDTLADAFGRLLGEVFAYGFDGAEKRILSEFGFHIGRYVYLADAADDLAEDKKAGRFNVLLHACADPLQKTEKGERISPHLAEMLKTTMRLDVKKAADAAALLDCSSCRDLERIAENILTCGLPHEIDRILMTEEL